MQVTRLAIPDVVLLRPTRHGDARGYFVESFNARVFAREVGDAVFVQDNESFSAPVGTLRGLHYQLPPSAQDKLVRVVRGTILDVAVDIRRDSPTFGTHVTCTLSAENGTQLFVPAGFAHGFLTLTPDVHVAYKVTALYDAGAERTIRWDDPTLGIECPAIGGVDAPTLSSRDASAPALADQPDTF